MDYYKDDLIKLINTEDINFIAYAVTPLHSIGINASIRRLIDSSNNLTGYILMMEHGTTGKVITEQDFDVAGTNIKVIKYIDSCKNKESKLNAGIIRKLLVAGKRVENKKIFLLWTSIPFSFFDVLSFSSKVSEICFVQIDDGGGSYANVFKDMLQFKLYEGSRNIISCVKAFVKTRVAYDLSRVVLFELKLNRNYIDNRIFKIESKKDGLHYYPNNNISKYYYNSFKNKNTYVEKEIIDACSGSILINTQCLAENKITDGIIDLKVYRELIHIASDMEMNVAIKPHPRELNLSKYYDLGVDVIPAELSQEVILAQSKELPKCIISVFSSTLLNAYGLFDIPAISLAKIMLREDIDRVFSGQLNDFIDQYKNVFIFPENMDELKKILINLTKN